MKVTGDNYDILKKASDITLVDYDIKWFDAENSDGYIDSDGLLSMIEDLILEYNHKEEELEDLKQDLEDNYQPRKIDPYEEYGVSRNDFF